MDKQVDVSVAVMTYFHEKYIAKAIESVLAQETTYSYEIVISDDASGDGTKAIIEDFARRYPQIIKIHINEKNLGISRNNYETRCRCTGRYIATLSGDDYWIDIHKIQKQVEYLDAHPECFSVVTAVEGRFDDSCKAFHVYPDEKYRGVMVSLEMYLHGAGVGTHGLMMRNAYLTEAGRQKFSLVPKASPYIDDATECLLILNESPVYSMDMHGVAYRVRSKKKGENNYNAHNSALVNFKKITDLYNYLYAYGPAQMDLFYLYKSNVAVGFAAAIQKCKLYLFYSIYKTIPEEYKKRALLCRAIPTSFSVTLQSLSRKVKARFKAQ